MKTASLLVLTGLLFVGGCAKPIPPAESAAMVPGGLNVKLQTDGGIYVEEAALASAAKDGKAPFDELTGTSPFVQAQGLVNFQKAIDLTLLSAGIEPKYNRAESKYILRATILGSMTIPFPQAYSVLFVHYQLEDARTANILWWKNIYSQAKLEKVGPSMGDTTEDPAYGRLAAANLRQMMVGLSSWLASEHSR